MAAPGRLSKKPFSTGAVILTSNGAHSTAQVRHIFLLAPPVEREVTQRSQKPRWHWWQYQRAKLFGWNLQADGAVSATGSGSITGGGATTVAAGASGGCMPDTRNR